MLPILNENFNFKSSLGGCSSVLIFSFGIFYEALPR